MSRLASGTHADSDAAAVRRDGRVRVIAWIAQSARGIAPLVEPCEHGLRPCSCAVDQRPGVRYREQALRRLHCGQGTPSSGDLAHAALADDFSDLVVIEAHDGENCIALPLLDSGAQLRQVTERATEQIHGESPETANIRTD